MAVMQRELRHPLVVTRRHQRRWERIGTVGTLTLAALLLWLAYELLTFSISWAQVKLDDVRYGYPRTYQMDGYVGYRESSGLPTHFVVINAHRQILILIVPGTDPGHVTVIKGPYLYGPNQDFSPATLELRDTNGDGYPDLVLHVAGQTVTYVNDPRHKTFVVPHTVAGGVQ